MTTPASQIVQWKPKDGPTRRIEFEPYGDGRYLRKARVWEGCRWRTTGTEVVDAVDFGGVGDQPRRAGESIRGP